MKLNPTISQLRRQTKWTVFDQVCHLTIEIIHWGEGEPHNNNGHGVWNYYIYIHERFVENKEKFNSLWLEDRVVQFFETSPARVTHDYMTNIPDFDLHGGITYYKKEGHTEGHRSVVVGCDYNHLYDQEHGPYCLEEVFCDALASMNKIYSYLTLP